MQPSISSLPLPFHNKPSLTARPRCRCKTGEHDMNNLTNVDASEMQSDPGDLAR